MIRQNYTFSNDLAAINRLVKKTPKYAQVFEKAAEKAKFARENFADKVEWISGWGHNFCCPDCASQMKMDVKMPFNPPNVFTCPNCGQKASSIDHDEAWVYYYRSYFGQLLRDCALCAVRGDKESLDFMIRYVDFYADNYDKFELHGKHAGKGKVMEQSLDEAVWTISVLTSLQVCGDLIPEEKKAYWFEKMYSPMIELYKTQFNSIHNISTWLKACVGVIGIYFKDDELLDYALNSEFGVRNQVAKGFTKDGIWYEGSMTYHYYTAMALSGFFAFYAMVAPENDNIFDTFAKMYTTPKLLCHDGYRLPCLNDGWYPGGGVSGSLTVGRVVDDKTINELNAMTAKAKLEKGAFSTDDLLFTMIEEDVVVLEDTHLAVVVNPFHVLFKSGVFASSHMHSDYLSIRISPFSDDLGTPGYGHEMTPKWYRLFASHNCVGIDGKQPYWTVIPNSMRKLENGACGAMEPGAFCGLAKAERSITVEGDTVFDESVFEGSEEHTFDWLFHSKGVATYSCDAEKDVESIGEGDGYQYFEDIKLMAANGSFEASFTLEDGQTLILNVPSTEGIEVYTAKTPDNPADKKRNTVLLRRKSKTAKFTVTYTKK